MSEDRPNHSLANAPGQRGVEKPALFLVKHFQVREAEYMKPPLAEQLLEPDGNPAPGLLSTAGVLSTEACACNSVCTCVPVSTCACNSVCTCNTVSSSHGLMASMPKEPQPVLTQKERTAPRADRRTREADEATRTRSGRRTRTSVRSRRKRKTTTPTSPPTTTRTPRSTGGCGFSRGGGYGGYYAPCF